MYSVKNKTTFWNQGELQIIVYGNRKQKKVLQNAPQTRILVELGDIAQGHEPATNVEKWR